MFAICGIFLRSVACYDGVGCVFLVSSCVAASIEGVFVDFFLLFSFVRKVSDVPVSVIR